jgi:hypothetical protein
MAPIAQQLQHLTELQLAGTSVTDAGVVQLTALRQLRRLTAPDAVTATARNLVLSRTGITAALVEAASRATAADMPTDAAACLLCKRAGSAAADD